MLIKHCLLTGMMLEGEVLATAFHPPGRDRRWPSSSRLKRGQAQWSARCLEGWRDAVKGIWRTIAPALS